MFNAYKISYIIQLLRKNKIFLKTKYFELTSLTQIQLHIAICAVHFYNYFHFTQKVKVCSKKMDP